MTVKINVKPDFSEVVDYIMPQYPIYIKGGLLSQYHNYTAVSHWHEDLEFIYILSGSMQYDVNGEIVTLHEKEGIVVNSRNFHYGFSEKREECEFICIIIHPSILSGNGYIGEHFVRPFTECEAIPFIFLSPELKWQQELLDKLLSIYQLQQDQTEFYFECQKIVLEIFAYLYINNKTILTAETNKADRSLVQLRKMVHFIQNHYSDPITLEEIAKVGELGKTACCNTFKKYMHTSPIDYVITFRMVQSVMLLTETDLSITEIAYEVGFHNASYYTKCFREYYRMTPRQMRKEFGK